MKHAYLLVLASAQDEFISGIGHRNRHINRMSADVLPASRTDVMDCFQWRREQSGTIDLSVRFHNI
jgi:hypothetical protein